MEAHSEGAVNASTRLSAGPVLYHCLGRLPNINITLDLRFVSDEFTSVILIVKSST